jgi:hypothetical protein
LPAANSLFCHGNKHVPFGASTSATTVYVIPSVEVKTPSTGWMTQSLPAKSANPTLAPVVNVLRIVVPVPRYRLDPACTICDCTVVECDATQPARRCRITLRVGPQLSRRGKTRHPTKRHRAR